MFKKNKNVDENVQELIENEISVDVTEPLYDEIKVPSRKELRKKRKKKKRQEKKTAKKLEKKQIKDSKKRLVSKEQVEIKKTELEEETQGYNIEWADNEVSQAKKRKKEVKVITKKETIELPKEEKGSIKKELDEYFLTNNSDLFIKKDKKKKRVRKKKPKLRTYYKYKNRKFRMPADFLEYLEKNPKKIEAIAEVVLEDELFFKWLGKNSHQFIESVKEFRIFKKKFEE